MNRKKTLDRIAELLSRFTSEVKTLNKEGLYDINIHAEDVLVPIINTVFDITVINANKEERNATAIDLVDTKNRISFQITSTPDSEKIKHTLNQFIKHERFKNFDNLFIYIITEKQKSYSGKGFEEITNNKFYFNKDEHIIDNSDLFSLISKSYTYDKIDKVKNLLEDEFSEGKISSRREQIQKQTKLITERIYSNILEIQLPDFLYMATLITDRNKIIEDSWDTEFKLKRTASTRAVVRRALGNLNLGYYRDWHVFKNQLITFRDLNDKSEPLMNLIDQGTIEIVNVEDTPTLETSLIQNINELIKYSFQQKVIQKGIKFIDSEEVFIYLPSKSKKKIGRKITWKSSKRTSTRHVVFPKYGEQKNEILYYRHLAFHSTCRFLNNNWYLIINPTYFFTSDGYKKSPYHNRNLKGIKRLENNSGVRNSVNFIAFHLNNYIERSEIRYDLIKIRYPDWAELTFEV